MKRLVPKKTLRAVNFFCPAPQAQAVHLVGDFNNWDPQTHPMQRQPDGAWRIQMELAHGYHHYFFLVDGAPQLDPRAQGTGRNKKGEQVSLVAVSGF